MPTTPLSVPDVLAVERAESGYFRRFLDRAPTADRERLGIRTTAVRGGVATVVTADPSGYWTKAMGFGADGAVDDDLIAEVVAFSVGAGATGGTVTIAPAFLPEDWEAICARHGLTAGSTWSKSACRIDDVVTTATTDLRISPLTVDDVPAWGRIIREAFGMTDPDLSPMLRGAVEDPLARVFGAFDGDLLVGAGALHLVDGVGSLNTGGTLPSYRRRGVQSALLAARSTAAAEAGCRLLTAETGSGAGNPSYRNLARSGFVHQYDRVNWTWSA